jgi:integrase/recombinase XerD
MLFLCLHRRGFIRANGIALMELPKVPRQPPRAFLDIKEVEATLRQSKLHNSAGVRDRAMLFVLYTTGVRRMEVGRLNLADIDFDKGIVTVWKSKGDRSRRVPIAPIACAWILAYLKYARPE